jgi:ribosome maturation factor RimP
MITESQILEIIKEKLEADDVFLVELKVAVGNRISVTVDKLTGISIDYCVQLSKYIDASLDREIEDFELEVWSAGIGQPFKVVKQYQKNIGNNVEVLTLSGQKLKGLLVAVSDSDFTVKVETKVKSEGKKKKELQIIEHLFKFEEVKSVKDIVTF